MSDQPDEGDGDARPQDGRPGEGWAGDEDSRLARAELLVSLGRYEDALTALAQLPAAEREGSSALCLTAQAQLQLDRPALARVAAEAALRADPDTEWPMRLLSIALRELGEHDAAVQMAARSVRMEPHLWEPRAILAIALSEARGTRHRARRVAETAVTLAPNEPQAHFVVGLVADRMGRQGDAEVAYRHALRLDPQHAAAGNNLSVILSRRGDYIGAANGFTEAAVGDPRLVIAGRNVDFVVIRLLQRAQVVVLITTFAVIAGPRIIGGGIHTISFAAALSGIGVIGWSAVQFHRATPRRLHRYLRTLPARDPLSTAWATLLAVTLLVLGVAALLPGVMRWWGFAVACMALLSASGLNYRRATRRERAPGGRRV